MRPSLKSAIVPIRNVQNVIDHARGASVERLLANTGLTTSDLAESERRVSYQQLIATIRNACASRATMPNASVADFLTLPRAFDISNYGILGYAMMSAENLGQAIDFAMKYYRTSGPLFALSFERLPDTAAIVLEPLFVLENAVQRAATEMLLSGFPPLVAELLGKRVNPVSVELAYPADGARASYEATFHSPILFDTPQTRYSIDIRELASPVLQADADSMRLLEQSCRELLAELENKDSLRGRIRHLLLASPGQSMHAERVAQQLNVSERTLRRHLSREGASFQEIVDEVRASMAKDYLRSTRLSTQQIAELVGFSEATNFRRAFLRWTSESPHQYRRAHRDAD